MRAQGAFQGITLEARPIYLAAAAASLLLSVWAAYAQFVPNPDAALYLRAAELFSTGQWREGAAVYHWPFYSMLIAAVMALSGVTALVACQVVNSLLYVLITVAFIALVGRLAQGDRVVLACAALIVVLHPRLLQLRSSVIRDHGMYAFLLLSFYWIVRDQQEPRFWSKVWALASIPLAATFRVEALFLAALVPAYYVFTQVRSRGRRLLVVGAVALLGSLLVPGFVIWSSGGIQRWILPDPAFDRAEAVGWYFGAVRERIEHLEVVLAPFGQGFEWIAYVSMTIGITVVEVLRAPTWPLALLAALAFVPRRLLPDEASRFVLWFAGWQIPMLLLFTFFNAFMNWRYAMTIVLLMAIPAVFTVAAVARGWMSEVQPRRWPAVAAALLIIGVAAVYFPKPSRLGYLMDAGQWVKANTSSSTRILTNDSRIAYFSGRKYDTEIVIAGLHPPTAEMLTEVDLAVIRIDRTGLPGYLVDRPGLQFLATVSEGRGQKVVAYRMR